MTEWIPKIGDKVKPVHRYSYRPDGCEAATVTHVYTDRKGRTQVGLIYDNAATDVVPISEFHPDSNNGEPGYAIMNEASGQAGSKTQQEV